MNTVNEIWRDCCEGPDKYEVSNLGNVRNKITKKYIKQFIHDGYLCVFLMVVPKTKQKRHRVHRLVYLSFYPNTNRSHDIHHIDRVKTNNCLHNLMDIKHDEHAKMEANLVNSGIAFKRGKEHGAFKYTIAGFCSITGELKYIFNGSAEIEKAGFCISYVYRATKTGRKYSKYHNLIFKKILDDSIFELGNFYQIEPIICQDRVIAIDNASNKITDIFIGSKSMQSKGFDSSAIYSVLNGKKQSHKNHKFLRIYDNQIVNIGEIYDPNKKIEIPVDKQIKIH
jgi:hypothetical protein